MSNLFSMDMAELIYTIIGRALVLLITLPIHEYAHGLVAYWLGDNTAQQAGRLTLNPFKHLDKVGSIMILVAGVGWAKPVPVNPQNFRNPKRDMALTALAGPGANLLLALFLTILYRVAIIAYAFTPMVSTSETVVLAIAEVLLQIIIMNIYLAVFNLLPVPPLDGSRLVSAVLPDEWIAKYQNNFSMVGRIIFMVFLFSDLFDTPMAYIAQHIFYFIFTTTQFVSTGLQAILF